MNTPSTAPHSLASKASFPAERGDQRAQERPARAASGRRRSDDTISLGDTRVHLVTMAREPTGLTYLGLQENEQTAVTAARQLIDRRGGRLVELRAQGNAW